MEDVQKRILRKPEVVQMAGLSHVTIWRLERAGKFPKRLQLGARAVGWLKSDVEAWMETRLAVNG